MPTQIISRVGPRPPSAGAHAPTPSPSKGPSVKKLVPIGYVQLGFSELGYSVS